MTDDVAMPEHGTPAKPAQIPPPSTPEPVESLEAVPTATLPDGPETPPQVPLHAEPEPARPTPAESGRVAPAADLARPAGAPRALAVVLALVCVLVLFGGGYLYWFSQNAAATVATRLGDLAQAVAALDQRVAALEKRPVSAPVDLRPLEQRITALEQKPPLVAQLDAAGRAAVAALSGRIDQLTARTDQLGSREQSDIGKLGDQIAQQDTRIAEQDSKIASALQTGAKTGGQVDALATREARLAALQSAAGALAAGRPLGPIPAAPPALAQFAEKAPPTEAALRLSFADAARAAREAGLPPQSSGPFLSRVWARMASLVTVRQGDRVIVGDAISGILEHAQSQLDAGDLAGAVATLNGLAGPAAAAMAPWKQQAQSLLDARAALLSLAHG